MPTFDLRFPPEVREALGHLAAGFDRTLTGAVANRVIIPADADADLADLWRQEVSARIDTDLDGLRSLFNDARFGQAPITLSEDEALEALRGFTVLRLTLRDTVLRDIPDQVLEQGNVDLRTLKLAVRHAYACYGALGEIQATLCDLME